MEPFHAIKADIDIPVGQIVNPESSLIVFPSMSSTEWPKAHIARRLTMFTLILFGWTEFSHTTTVVGLRAPSYVILGSDSLEIGSNRPTAKVCKIQQIGGIAFSASGAVGEIGKGSTFNVVEVAERLRTKRADARGWADDLAKSIRGPFTAYLGKFRREQPNMFSNFCNSRECLQFAVASFTDGIPRLSARAFFVTTVGARIVVRPAKPMDCPGTCVTGAEQVILGVNEEATALFNSTPRFWAINGISKGIDALIGTEVLAHPEVVGPPVSILILDSSGPRWWQDHQGFCPDVIPTSPDKYQEQKEIDRR
jgi:hypothetical protein